MAFSDEAYQALEDIVGKSNVSRDPAVLDGYAVQMLAELVRPNLSHYMPRAVAVVMPASVEEVRAVVRLANKYKVKVKPHGTGWYHWASAMYEDKDTLQLDLRRMNKIEIDEKNGIAIVEPYVIHAQLHAEAIKRGWSCNVIGAGASTSVVASACAYTGVGPGTMWMGGNAENVLGMEWVTPSGDIVRNGSLGSGDGWFCSEGPGPSVRGIMRGTFGCRGGFGVYTKCAIKLTHWPGSTDWPVYGTVPAYRLPIDKTMRAYTVAVPTWDAWADAYFKIYDNELGYIAHRQFNLAGADLAPTFWLMYNDPTKQLGDIPEMVKETGIAELTEEMRISFQIILAGRSEADIELQDKILDTILEEVGGWKVQRYCEKDMAEFTNMYMNRLGHKEINYVYAGQYIGSWMQPGTPDWVKGYIPAAAAGLERDYKDGLLVQSGGDSMMGTLGAYPGGGVMGLEQFVSYDGNDLDSCRAAWNHMDDAVKDAAAIGYPPGKEALYIEMRYTDDECFEKWSNAKQPWAYVFQRKIKEHYDPNDVGDRMYNYIPEEYEKKN
ncbi:MAG TPA: FAD-binding oxidoreductase [Thermoleophilia bacterium]|nr:FAD-binding oxidoreductase [Thermoleophilia bacterium]